jgi:hypothetical protein
MKKKYRVLRFIAFSMKVLGFIVAALTILAVLGVVSTGVLGGAAVDRLGRDFGQDFTGLGVFAGLIWGLVATIFPIVFGGSLAMFLFAGGEALELQMDIEENTRTVAWYLQRSGGSPALAVADIPPQNTPLPVSTPPPRPNSTSYSFCPQCGYKLSPSDKSCPQCHYVLDIDEQGEKLPESPSDE